MSGPALIQEARWSPPALKTAQEKEQYAAYVQGLFDWCAPLGADWVNTTKAAKWLDESPQHVLRLCEDATLESRIISRRRTRKAGKGVREERKISRRSILLRFAMEAQVNPREHVELFLKWVDHVKCPHFLRMLAERMPARIAAALERAGR